MGTDKIFYKKKKGQTAETSAAAYVCFISLDKWKQACPTLVRGLHGTDKLTTLTTISTKTNQIQHMI